LPNEVVYGIIFLLMNDNLAGFSWSFIGNGNLTGYLQKTISEERIGHAYIFNGLEHLGKKTCADLFASSLLCHQNIKKDKSLEAVIPCGKCEGCIQVINNRHPDVFLVEADLDKKDISLEQIQSLRYNLKMSSFYNNYKVGIVNQAEKLNISSVNALLKTLEEPTEKTVIILITNMLNRLPKTVISRCQVFNFQSVDQATIAKGLKEKGVDQQKVYELASLAQGRPGLAIQFLDDSQKLLAYKNEITDFLNIRSKSKIRL